MIGRVIATFVGNWRMIAIVSFIASVALAGTYLYGYTQGKQAVQNKSMNLALKIREKQNEAIANRPDTNRVLIERLRSGRF